ncbi:MAG TPA: nucleoside hydrolase [Bryobacteraceae bacterium]|nr:nucleoside hydrolase [Bryobacteraceae bacterium]
MGRAIRVSTILLLAFTARLAAQDKISVVLSTDVGNEVDDQWAIVYLLTNPKFDVKGILSAHAPSISPPAGRTALRILRSVVEDRMGMRMHPPLLEGASVPLKDRKTPIESPAVDFLIETSRKYTAQSPLTVLAIGATTDVASAILKDPSITHRIRVIDMGFQKWPEGGKEFNIENDVKAMQVLLASDVPLVIGSAEVCKRDLALSLQQAKEMVGDRGPIGEWLFTEFEAWYYRYVKPLRKDDFSKPWIIWDNIALAYVLGMTAHEDYPRPLLRDDMVLEPQKTDRKITWITKVDHKQMWADFLRRLDEYQQTHAVTPAPLPGRLSFMLP